MSCYNLIKGTLCSTFFPPQPFQAGPHAAAVWHSPSSEHDTLYSSSSDRSVIAIQTRQWGPWLRNSRVKKKRANRNTNVHWLTIISKVNSGSLFGQPQSCRSPISPSVFNKIITSFKWFVFCYFLNISSRQMWPFPEGRTAYCWSSLSSWTNVICL